MNPMNQNPVNPIGGGMPNPGMPNPMMGGNMPTGVKKTSWIALAVFVILTAGFVYYYFFYAWQGGTPETNPDTQPVRRMMVEEDNATMMLQDQSASDDLNDIEKDLNATDLNSLDKETADINSLLQ